MRKSNLVKSLTNLVNNRKGLLILCLITSVFGVDSAWGTYYAEVSVSGSPTGKGSVYVNQKGQITHKQSTGLIGSKIEFSIGSEANKGYHWESWTSDPKAESLPKQATGKASVKASSKDEGTNSYKITASFAPNSYTVTYVGNGNTGGSTGDSDHKYDEYKNLTSNGFTREYKVTYNYAGADGGEMPIDAMATYTFNHWTCSENSNRYSNGQSVINLTSVENAKVTMTAQWESGSVILPKPTRTGYTFNSWKNEGGSFFSAGAQYVSTTAEILYAQWTAISYNVQYNANGGSGSMSNLSFKYDEQKSLTANSFTNSYTISFEGNGGSAPNKILSSRNFEGWATSATGSVIYSDQQSVCNLTETQDATVPLYAHWSANGEAITLPSASKDNSVLVGWYNGDTFIGEQGDSYTPSESVTLTAHWASKYDITVTGSDQNMKVGGTQENAFTFVHADNPITDIKVVSIDPINNGDGQVIEYDAANNKIIAHNAGTATICFKQAGTETMYESTSASFTYTVSKEDNTLSVAADSREMKVDEQWTGVISDKNSNATVTTTSSDETIAYYDVANNKIVACNSNNQSFDSAKVTITIEQEETHKYTGASKTIEVKVEKYDNIIYINNIPTSYSTPISINGTHAISITSTNEDYQHSPFEVTQTQGAAVAVINAEHTQITVSSLAGAAMWTITQPENYKYKAGSATINIEVQMAGEATNCYVLNAPDEKSYGKYGDCANKSYQDFNLNGPGKVLTFKMWKYSKANDIGMHVLGYNAQGNQVFEQEYSIGSLPTSAQQFTITIDPSVTRIRMRNGGGTYASASTLNCYVKDIKVTRYTYLTANDLSITTTSTGNSIYPGESGSGTITINRSLANGGNLHISWNNDKFTINGKKSSEGLEIAETDCTTGTEILNVVYTSSEAGEHEATVTINNAVYSTTCTLKGTTKFSEQTITWKENIDILTAGTDIEDPASSTVGNVTYTSSDETVISVEGNIIHALKAGTATITAFSAGNAYYADTTEQKEITVTDDKVQYIVWNQSLTNLKLGGEDKTLTASAQSDVDGCTTNGARQITYTSSNDKVVKIVNNNQLQIIGVGIATVTASQAGGEDADGHKYIPVSMQKKAVVRDPDAACVNYIYEQPSEWSCDLGWNLATTNTETHEIDFGGLEPGYFNLDYMGKSHDVAVHYYEGKMYVDEWVDNQWKTVKEIGQPSEDKYFNTGDIALSRKATKMRFRATGKAGYFYFKDCTVTLARYLEAANTLNKFEAKVNAQHKQTLSIKYSNIEGPLTLKLTSGTSFSIDTEEIEGECGSKGTADIVITYFPKATNEEETDVLTITDGKSSTLVINLTGSASKTERHIVWEQEPTSVYTVETITFNAEAKTTLNEEAGEVYYTLAQNSTAKGTINGNTLSFSKFGTAYVAVNTKSDDKYTDAVAITKTWTVSKTPTQITTKPTISGDIISGTNIASLILQGGAAQNTVNNQAVEGTFAVTAGDLVNVGEQTLTITFTPNNTDMYEGCTTTITANVIQREPTAGEVGIPSAMPITYGEVINTSSLSGNGTLAGTWSWTDEDANKAMPNAGTVNNLNVYFTPTDANVKETNGTVSLTVYRATPELTWTAEHATATVHKTKTFTASSTNTDNTATITYSIISGGDCASINATTGEVTMTKAGTITIQASQAETTNYSAVNIETTCTISVAPTTITTAPTTDNIVSGTSLNEVILTGGEAQNTINSQAVAGTFAVTAGNLVNVGQQTLTITFTPTEGNKYAGCTTTITATIVPRTPTNEEIGTPSATDIVYGNAVKSSALSRDGGTLAGTWSWSDTRKDDILNAGTYDDLQVHFVPENKNYNEADATVSLTVNKAEATLIWETAPTEANVQEHLTYKATSNHSESPITYSIIEGSDYATIDANTGALTITKAGTITVQASQAASTNYEEAAAITITTTLTGEFETVFTGDGDWNDPDNWTHGLPTSTNPDVVISGNMTINKSISVGSLTIEEGGSVTIQVSGDLSVNGTSAARDAYGNLYVQNGGNVTIGSEANVCVFDFVIESSIGTSNGTSQSGQVDNGDKVLYTNGAYIDINMDPRGHMVDAQWYGFTVPFPVDVQNGVSRKEGETFRKCTYGKEHMIAEYDMDQRKNTGKGWKYIKTGRLQPGHFYYFTANVPDYNVYRFKAADNTITIQRETQLVVNGDGPDANWNAVGNTTLTYATISGESLPQFVQTYVNGESQYIPIKTNEVQFVVGCPFFVQATADKPMVLNKPTETNGAHYAPRQVEDNSICVRIAEEGKRFSDQMYISASEDAQGQYQMGRDLAKAGVGTKSAQLWINAYNQQLCVNDAPLVANQAFYDMSLFIPKAGNYEISLPTTPTNGTLYLTQDGYPIWNLNDAPFVIELGKGTISEYGLMFEATQAAAPTDAQTISGNDNAQKILKEQSIYIYKNGNIFNVTGQKVK